MSMMRTPLIQCRNISPVTAREFGRLGVYTVEQLKELGWKEACLLRAECFLSRINLNVFRSVIGAVYGVDYQIPPDEDADTQRKVIELRNPGVPRALRRSAECAGGLRSLLREPIRAESYRDEYR
jgi:hypothetical protein